VSRGKTVFSALDEDGNVLAKKGEDVVYGKDGITPLSPSEWYAAQRTENPHWFPPSSGGGAPALHGGNGTGVDYSKLPPEERLTAIRAARAAGRA
jgi:hypothetical protein